MVRSRFGRIVYGGLGLLVLALPFLVASDRNETFDGGYAGTLALFAPMAIALIAYAAPNPPRPGELPAPEARTLTVDGAPVAGTLLALPRGRRIVRVVYRGGWVLFAVLLTVALAMEPEGAGTALAAGGLALVLTPGLVSAVRGLLDPGLTGVFLAPEGVAVRGPRRFLPWSQLQRPEVYSFDYRGITSHALMLRRNSGRAYRGPEASLPALAEDLVELVETVRDDEDARAQLRQGRLPGRREPTLSGLT